MLRSMPIGTSAISLFHLGENDRAFSEWQAALAFLAEESRRYRFAAFLNIATVANEHGDESAERVARREAERLTDYADANLRADLWFYKAKQAAGRGEYTAAVDSMQKCMDSFSGRLNEKLGYSMYLVLYQLEAGQAEKAVATAKAMATLIVQSDDPTDYVASIAMELVRAATSAEERLTRKLANECLEAIQSAQQPQRPCQNRPSR